MSDVSTVEFFFDPGCPWTWLTSRWLVDAAATRGIDIEWRSLSLGVLNEGNDVPAAYRAPMVAAASAHRLFAALRAAGRNDLVGALYTAIGDRTFRAGGPIDRTVVEEAARTVGADAWLSALDDENLDGAVRESTNEAVELAGPDVGSPVLAFGEPRLGVFGPIVSPAPTGEDATRLLDHVLGARAVPGFYELKRGRREGPQLR